MKDKKGIAVANAFQNNLDESNHTPYKIYVDKGSEFYNGSMKTLLQGNNNIEMYSTHHEWKSVVAEKFSRTLKNEIYEHITSISKSLYIDELDHIFNKYNNTYYSTISMKLVDVNSNTYIDINKENNKEDPEFEVGYHEKISTYKNIVVKGYTPN